MMKMRRALAAGELGASVRQLARLTGTDIKSWNEDAKGASERGTRTFLLQVRAIKS